MTREEINTVHSLLWKEGFRQMWFVNLEGNHLLYVHSNAIMVNPNVDAIKELIGDKYSVTGDTNSETITIK